MYSFIVYRALTNPYMRLVRVSNGNQWDVSNDVESRTATFTDTDTALSKDANVGGIGVTIPPTLPAGEWDVLFYDAASPSANDAVEFGKRISWTGSQIIGLPLDV